MPEQCVQFFLTPAAGKRLIAKALMAEDDFARALRERTVVLVAGSTNAYVAEEALAQLGETEGFDRRGYLRGVTKPAGLSTAPFIGDVVIEKGRWQRGKTIFDVSASLKEGDVIVKGANAVRLSTRDAAVLIGHPRAGTVAEACAVAIGSRVRLIMPVGAEKRVEESVFELAALVNRPGASGPRLFPVAGCAYTEIDAIEALSGARARLLAGGGVAGCEGGCHFVVCGEAERIRRAREWAESVADEPPFTL